MAMEPKPSWRKLNRMELGREMKIACHRIDLMRGYTPPWIPPYPVRPKARPPAIQEQQDPVVDRKRRKAPPITLKEKKYKKRIGGKNWCAILMVDKKQMVFNLEVEFDDHTVSKSGDCTAATDISDSEPPCDTGNGCAKLLI